MAGARLEKVGTIFARMNAMLRKNVLPQGEKPIWFEIYALHPPCNEPRYDQKSPVHGIKEILYEDDLIRSKLHERVKLYETIDFSNHNYESKTKRFISLYKNLKEQGALDDEKVFEVALEQLHEGSGKQHEMEALEHEVDEPVDFGIVKSFTKALEENKSDKTKIEETPKKKDDKTDKFDVKSLF